MLIFRDMQEYKQCVMAHFAFGRVVDSFDLLSDLASIHLVGASQLRTLIDESSLNTLSRAQLLDYIRLRTDYKPAWVQQYKLLDEKKQ